MLDFHNLVIWQRSHNMTLEIYRITQKQFPREEIYGLTSQIRRAMSSIPTNIAEGRGRKSQSELVQFLNIAAGSASEVEYQLLLAKDINYITLNQFNTMTQEICEIRSMIQSYMGQTRNNSKI